MEHKQQRDDLAGRHAARVAPARRGPTATPPIAAQTPGRNHRPRKKPRRSDPTSSPPSLSDRRLPQKAFQAQSLSRAKTPYPGYRTLGDPENVTVAVGQFRHTLEKRVGILTLTYRGEQSTLDETTGPMLMGRDAGCGPIVQSDWASRRHATLEIQNSRFTLTDHSTNGTFCLDDNQRLQVLKRQATYLLTSGTISLGIDPIQNQDNLIRYEFSKN